MSSWVVTSIWTLAEVSAVQTCLRCWKPSYWAGAIISENIHRSLILCKACEQGTQLQRKEQESDHN